MKKTSKTKSNKNAKKTKEHNVPGIRNEIISIIVFMFAVYLYISISNFQGLPEDTRFIGLMGTYVTKGLELILGEGALLLSFYMLFWSLHIGMSRKLWSIRMWGVSLLFLAILVALSLYAIPKGITAWEAGIKGMGGGYLGGGIAYILVKLGGQVGAAIFLFLGILLGMVMLINKSFGEINGFVKTAVGKLSGIMFYEIEEEPGAAPSHKDSPLIVNNGEAERGMQAANVETVFEPAAESDFPPDPSDDKSLGDLEMVISQEGADYDYQKPPLDMLSDISSERIIDKKNIRQTIAIIEETFSNFGVAIKVNQVSCGPAVTRYEVIPAPGVKISRIISLTDDLQLNLAAPGIRIEAPIPGKSAIGIEVPNSRVSRVGLANLLASAAFKKLNSPLAFSLGEDISGNAVVARLNDMPHLLIAGSTGSGKSVCLNSIIMSFLYNTTPDELKLVFIDPKMVELTAYNGIPHLMTPVVTDPKKASVVLRWMVREMEKRYKLFAEKAVRDVQKYNRVAKERMPYIVIIIDELADLMSVAPVEVEDSIYRLAQMARAAGIHLIVATQRPSVDVVTGVIKGNIPSRIAFAVSSQADSRTILDTGGAEKLLGKGDMLFYPVGSLKPFRVQGAYVSDADIEKTVNFLKQQASEIEEPEQLKEMEISLEESEEEDELFWDAVNLFVKNKKASVSLLQRKLRIGYARAARLVDLMEERGIVSELDNNKKRKILIDSEQLARIYTNDKL